MAALLNKLVNLPSVGDLVEVTWTGSDHNNNYYNKGEYMYVVEARSDTTDVLCCLEYYSHDLGALDAEDVVWIPAACLNTNEIIEVIEPDLMKKLKEVVHDPRPADYGFDPDTADCLLEYNEPTADELKQEIEDTVNELKSLTDKGDIELFETILNDLRMRFIRAYNKQHPTEYPT